MLRNWPSCDESPRLPKDFQVEVDVLSQVEHLNLVRPMGFLERNERLPVTEYVFKGNLRQHLHDNPNGMIPDTSARLNIAIDVAQALTYNYSAGAEVEVPSDYKAAEEPDYSLHVEEGVDSEDTAVHYDEESESGEGSARRKWTCSVCGLQYLKLSLLKQHMCAHSEDRPFVCPVENCGRQYKRQDHLNRHLLTHKGNLFSCTWEGCDLSFNVNANLQRHLRLHEKWGANLLRGSKGADSRIICLEPGCSKVFKYPSLLQTHTENVHDSLSTIQAVCMETGCGEIFDDLSQLKLHRKAAHCYVVCDTCGISMLKNKLKTHAQIHEGAQELIRCPYPGCQHSYNKKSNLDTHIRAIHMNLKPYACSHAGCEMRFAYRVVRDKHERCSLHVKPVLEGDFETEDLEFQMKSRGGRKRLVLRHIDDLFSRKR